MNTRSGQRPGSNGDGLGDSPARAAAARAKTAITGKRRLAMEMETPAATATGLPSMTPENGIVY